MWGPFLTAEGQLCVLIWLFARGSGAGGWRRVWSGIVEPVRQRVDSVFGAPHVGWAGPQAQWRRRVWMARSALQVGFAAQGASEDLTHSQPTPRAQACGGVVAPADQDPYMGQPDRIIPRDRHETPTRNRLRAAIRSRP